MEEVERLPQAAIYSDGACRGNPGVGGYGSIISRDGREQEITGAEARTTNNRMELTAAIRALESLEKPCRVRLVTDSQYLKKGMTEWIESWVRRGWKTANNKKVLNRDLWERLLELTRLHSVSWEWVAGHAGHCYNERCDRLANRAIDELLGEHGSGT